MSRHTFDTQYRGRAVEVVLGYDRPLDHFFLTVMFDDSDDDMIVYSNLDDPDAGFHQGLDYYGAKLACLGIDVPESMFRETEQDAIRNAGNRVVYHYEDGRYETIQQG